MLGNSVYLAYKKSPPHSTWHVIGLLSYSQERQKFIFKYTKGAEQDPNFKPFNGMENIKGEYSSEELFPLFKNRILYEKRPEYANFISWLGLDKNANPIDILALSGGHRITDNLQTFGIININDDKTFTYSFFVHGLSSLTKNQLERIALLKPTEKLYLCLDRQNEYDNSGVLIRTNDPKEFIGFCPRYLSKTLTDLINKDANSITLYVENVNNQAPLQYKLKCTLKGKLPEDGSINFYSDDEFKPLG
ncbi:restriction endonuclease [[Pasteurella] aerogenes]|nr:restriction endonuclease [[Pasteurella] aerogenes]MDY4594148.1 HIRAN domain-containing protein [[Pasteurella] aerogenes]UWZ92352.1 restriction endonuclease [[Pasteurella] aerogenes]